MKSTITRSILLSCLAGLALAGLLLALGLKALPIVFSLVFILPWLVKDSVRLFMWLIITWPLLTLFLRIPLPGGIPDISYDRLLILALISITLIEALLSKRQLAKVTLLDILIIVYVIAQLSTRIHVMWFGGIGNVDLNVFLDGILLPVMLYWVAKNLLASKAQLQWLLYALVIAALLICPTGLYEQAVGARIFKTDISLGGSEVSYQWRDPQGGLRAAGALANPAIYGGVLGMGALAAMCCLYLTKRKWLRAALVATIALLLYGVFASYTRSAWLSVIAVLIGAQFFVNGLWKRTIPILIIGLVVLVLVWNVIPNNSGIVERTLNTKTIDQRLVLVDIGWQRFLQKPLFGWGSGALNIFGLLEEGNTSHNVYETLLVDGGVILFLSFLAVAGYVLTRAIQAYRISKNGSVERNVLVAIAGNILIFLLLGFALELRYFAYFNALFWISAGVIDSLGTRRNSERTADA